MEAQCHSCRFWERRGGFMAERRVKRCVALEQADPGLAVAVTGLLRLAAASGQCPQFDEPPTYPDSYRSLDLEDQEELGYELEGRVR